MSKIKLCYTLHRAVDALSVPNQLELADDWLTMYHAINALCKELRSARRRKLTLAEQVLMELAEES